MRYEAQVSAMNGMDPLAANSRMGVVVVSHQQKYLRECLASVLAQSASPADVVLVDNGSPADATAFAIAEEMGVSALRLDRSKSLATARNVGCEFLDDCDYVLTLDGDDLLEPRCLEVYSRAALEHRVDVVYGPAELFGSMSGVAFLPPEDGKRQDLRRGNFIPAMALFSRSMWRAAGGYDPHLAYYEDYEFWLSFAERGAKFHRVDEVLWRYRRHPTSMLATAQEDDKAASRRYLRAKHLRYIWGPLQWRRFTRNVQKAMGRE